MPVAEAAVRRRRKGPPVPPPAEPPPAIGDSAAGWPPGDRPASDHLDGGLLREEVGGAATPPALEDAEVAKGSTRW
eukprot:2979882-Pyramimonas_sp.AAC.1